MDINTQEQLAVAELQPIIQNTSAYTSTIDGLEIHDDEQLALAGDLDKDLNRYRMKLEDKRTSLVQPLNKVVKDINELFSAPRDKIDELRAKLKKKMVGYITRMEQLEKEKKRQEAEEARAREERLRKAAELAKQQAGDDAADMVEVLEKKADEAAAAQVVIPAKRSAPVRGFKSSVSTVKTWVGEVVDVKAACLAIAEGRLPASLVSFSQSDLNGLARAIEEEKTVDGVKYSQKISAGVR
jgi:exonuclease VII large subunit